MIIIYKIQDWLRSLKWWLQKKRRGWSDLEVWNLDNTFCEWIIPRLKDFRARTFCYPEVHGECESLEEWQALLDEMIFGFEWALKESEWYREHVFCKSGKDRDTEMSIFKSHCKRAQHGRELFGKWMTHLWW